MAIKDFLEYAYDNWNDQGQTEAPPPLYVLIVGDATQDMKNYRGEAVDNGVPTYIFDDLTRPTITGQYASDTFLTMVAGFDGWPDLIIGRIPVRAVGEADAAFAKILDYETLSDEGEWKENIIAVADRAETIHDYDPLGNNLFEVTLDGLIEDWVAPTPFTYQKFYYEQLPWDASDPTGFRDDFINALNGEDVDPVTELPNVGASLVVYIGHGTYTNWSRRLLFDTQRGDHLLLHNRTRLPYIVAANCVTGGFHTFATECQAETLLKYSDGGCIAYLGPSGPTYTNHIEDVTLPTFWGSFGFSKAGNLGMLALRTWYYLVSVGAFTELEDMILFGDPSLDLLLRAPEAPADIEAVGGNHEITVTWSPSPDVDPAGDPGSGYQLYRHEGDDYEYLTEFEMIEPLLTDTKYLDEGLENGRVYCYWLRPVDGDGFEGSPSEVACAMPRDPDPPSPPQGVLAVDPATGGQLDVSWQFNPPEDEVETYRIYYGKESRFDSGGIYDDWTEVPSDRDNRSLTMLDNWDRYYLAVTAISRSMRESDYSEEVSEIPTEPVEGAVHPAMISNLMVYKDGDDIRLEWGVVTDDILGRPIVHCDLYTMYREEDPDFNLDAVTPLGTLREGIDFPPGTTEFQHIDDGAAFQTPDYYYLVTATSDQGYRSGASADLPAGIDDMRMRMVPGGFLLEWSPVTEDIQGGYSRAELYIVYTSDDLITREQTGCDGEPGCLDRFADTTDTQVLIPDGDPAYDHSFFYVLVVDFRGNMSPN